MCTTAFLGEISQYIKFGDLTTESYVSMAIEDQSPMVDEFPAGVEPGMEARFSKGQEDLLVKDTTGDLPDWVANFIRRVILLLENLPEETSNSDGTTEGSVRCLEPPCKN
jgi:proteasome activator subunit 4